MPRKKLESNSAITPLMIESRIHLVRGVRVMLDSDLAELYEIETHVLNQAVKRNLDRFPSDFSFVLSAHELTNLISQTVISSSSYGGRRKPTRVFTEHGVAMLSSVLRSPIAVRVNIDIIRSFIKMRQIFATPGELIAQLQELSKTVQLHDSQIKSIMDILQKMMEPPPVPPHRGRIGFSLPNSNEDRA